jgi:hypothetical protein
MKRITLLHVGGLVAAGFDETGRYLLTISHSGRGVFDTSTWQQVTRDVRDAYPDNGVGIGIGPIDGEKIAVTEKDYSTEKLELLNPHGDLRLSYAEGIIEVNSIE